jgi:hypothetical protein
MCHGLVLVTTVLAVSACHGATARQRTSANALRDTSFMRLCAAAPETTSAGTVGCELKDQGRPPFTKAKPPQ